MAQKFDWKIDEFDEWLAIRESFPCNLFLSFPYNQLVKLLLVKILCVPHLS